MCSGHRNTSELAQRTVVRDHPARLVSACTLTCGDSAVITFSTSQDARIFNDSNGSIIAVSYEARAFGVKRCVGCSCTHTWLGLNAPLCTCKPLNRFHTMPQQVQLLLLAGD